MEKKENILTNKEKFLKIAKIVAIIAIVFIMFMQIKAVITEIYYNSSPNKPLPDESLTTEELWWYYNTEWYFGPPEFLIFYLHLAFNLVIDIIGIITIIKSFDKNKVKNRALQILIAVLVIATIFIPFSRYGNATYVYQSAFTEMVNLIVPNTF